MLLSFILLFCFISLWIFLYKQLKRQEIPSNIVFSILSMTHWFFAFLYFQVIVAFNLDKFVKDQIFGKELTQIQLCFHILTCSYYSFDLIAKHIENQLNSWLKFHHGATLLFIFIALVLQQAGSENIYILRYATFCNVPMNIREILNIRGNRNLNFQMINILYIIIYSFNFLYCLPWCMKKFYEAKTNYWTQLLLIALCSQAWYTIFTTLKHSLKMSINHIKNFSGIF